MRTTIQEALEDTAHYQRRFYQDYRRAQTTPWLLAKEEAARPRLQTVLYNLAESLRIIGILLVPYLPTVLLLCLVLSLPIRN